MPCHDRHQFAPGCVTLQTGCCARVTCTLCTSSSSCTRVVENPAGPSHLLLLTAQSHIARICHRAARIASRRHVALSTDNRILRAVCCSITWHTLGATQAIGPLAHCKYRALVGTPVRTCPTSWVRLGVTSPRVGLLAIAVDFQRCWTIAAAWYR